jgi:hypothetical protein
VLVEALDVELVHDQDTARADEVREPAKGVGERLDVVQRDHRQGGVEGRRRLVHVVQRDLPHARRRARRIDGEYVVAALAQHAGQLPVARPDLEHASRRGRQRRSHEGHDVGREHAR